MAALGQRDEFIELYFMLGLSYKDILATLASENGIIISLRHLKRILKGKNLYRRKSYSDIADVVSFIANQLENSGQLHGYRWMHAKCFVHNMNVRKEDVRLILSAIDPVGCMSRRSKRLHRRRYFAKGPNYIWHLDSYDKLKPFGFCINGCIDGFSRNMVWLYVSNNSSNPKLIAGYFITTLKKIGGCPALVRADLGTENCYVRDMQRFLRRNEETGLPVKEAYLEGASTHNQRIEYWWGFLRKECAEFWITLFHRLRDDGNFIGDLIDKNILQFCFMGLIQEELDETVRVWNVHAIRPSRNEYVPSGRPMVMYELPQLFNTRDYMQQVPVDDIEACAEECLFRQTYPCDRDVFDLCSDVMSEFQLMFPKDPYEGVDLYMSLRGRIRENVL